MLIIIFAINVTTGNLRNTNNKKKSTGIIIDIYLYDITMLFSNNIPV